MGIVDQNYLYIPDPHRFPDGRDNCLLRIRNLFIEAKTRATEDASSNRLSQAMRHDKCTDAVSLVTTVHSPTVRARHQSDPSNWPEYRLLS